MDGAEPELLQLLAFPPLPPLPLGRVTFFKTSTEMQHNSRTFQPAAKKHCGGPRAKHLSSVTSEGMHFYTEFPARHTILKSEKVQAAAEQEHGGTRKEKTPPSGLLLLWAPRKMNGFYPAKQTLAVYRARRGCAQICCVFVFHYSSLQTHTLSSLPNRRLIPDAAHQCDCHWCAQPRSHSQ
ncbi:unnamed protein product [Pleuronectes platessa]|uniref:Uncharacterized protein n=1 Tax=Pleuronectes platessa TaxID=8262 RepID=A0A9N7TIP4_PLEPL|nr:unnamed protein product [Pleuronectes platessa]